MQYISLPPEFIGLEGKVQWVQQINANELHSSCPNCGISGTHRDGRPYSDADPSDRFVMWLESRSNGKPFGMCVRGCGYKWTPDKADAIWTDEEKAVFVQKRKELERKEEERILHYAQTVVMKHKLYERYMAIAKESPYFKEYMSTRGFDSDEWNRFFGFGFYPDYRCKGSLSTYYSPAITIPISGLGRVVEQIKIRVTDPHHKNDRFRNLYATKAQHAHFPLRDREILSKVALFEGEMKGAFVAKTGQIPNDTTIIATQGMGISQRVINMVENAEVVYLCLDPDAFAPNEKGTTVIMNTAKKIGLDRTRIIVCKQQINDAMMQGFNLRNAYNMAVKPQSLGLKV